MRGAARDATAAANSHASNSTKRGDR